MSQARQWWERVTKRRSHYRAVFRGQSGEFVLADLRKFCKAGEPPIVISDQGRGQTDIYATGMAAGRQEVFWRIAHHLHLDDAKLLQLKETLENDND